MRAFINISYLNYQFDHGLYLTGLSVRALQNRVKPAVRMKSVRREHQNKR